MKPIQTAGTFILAAAICGTAYGQSTTPQTSSATHNPAAKPGANGTAATAESSRANAYFDYTMGHIMEQEYQATSDPEYATEAIEYYKKAYALDPNSPVIGERLAEMYWESQRVQDAEAEAHEILKNDPNNVATRRLLGHIYLRSLGDPRVASGQSEMVQKAIEQFRNVVRLDPSDTESALWLARLYRLQNDPDKAEAVLRGILKEDPENEPTLEQLTQLLLDEGKAEQAIGLLEGITAKTPTATLLDLLGDAYTQDKDFAKAEVAYRKAVEIDPSEPSHYRGLGQALLSEEKYPEALKVYQKLIRLTPEDADNYLHLAQIYRQLRQFDKAEESLLKAKQYAPGKLQILYNEAMLYEAQGRYDDAIAALSEALTNVKAQSDDLTSNEHTLAVLYEQLGQLYEAAQNYTAAINTYQELSHLGEKEDQRAQVLMMNALRAAKELPKALETGKKACAKYPSDLRIKTSYALLLGENEQTDDGVKLLRPMLNGTAADREIYLNIAQIYERGHRYKEAEEAARAAEALPGTTQDNEMTWFLLGAVYERQKMYDKAEVEFKKVLAVDPKNAATLNYYGYMLGDLGERLNEAQGMVEKALKEDPYNGAYLDSLGWIYYKQDKLPEAEALLQKALQRLGDDPTILGHLGDVYAKLGRPDLAATEWEKSLVEWKRALPADMENDKIAEMEKRVNQSKHRVAQKTAPDSAKPQ